ncbi:MAG: DUF3299 domain-containing protein [Betaproteobacteria bacterium]
MKQMVVLLLAAGLAGAAHAQTGAGGHAPPPGSKFGAPPDGAAFKPLPERKDVVSWKLLAQVELVKLKDRYAPQYAAAVTALDKKDVKLQGFMMPLQMGDKQSHFVLTAMPQSCAFCVPGGPEQMVEVKTKRPVAYGFDAVVLSGRLEVLKDDPNGLFYRLTDAVPAK